ncbi:MAG: TraX family protein [Aedoeadaptatus pacaensis]
MEAIKKGQPPKRWQVFNGAQLKYMAFLSMLLDHVNNALITPYLDGKGLLLHVSNLLSILGRVAFPLFMFFLVEGFFKTRSRKKYLINLLIFGILSEVPFDLFTSRELFNKNWNNMMFTLALSLATIWIVDEIKGRLAKKSKALWYGASFVIVAAMCAVAMFFSLDYDYHAIIVAYLFYLFYEKPLYGAALGYLSIIKELYSVLGFAATLTYNGERGKQYKWLNYAFYPVHLLILGLLRVALKI